MGGRHQEFFALLCVSSSSAGGAVEVSCCSKRAATEQERRSDRARELGAKEGTACLYINGTRGLLLERACLECHVHRLERQLYTEL